MAEPVWEEPFYSTLLTAVLRVEMPSRTAVQRKFMDARNQIRHIMCYSEVEVHQCIQAAAATGAQSLHMKMLRQLV